MSRHLTTLLLVLFATTALAQPTPDAASINSSIAADGTGRIIVEAHGTLPTTPVIYSASANANITVGSDRIEQTMDVTIKVIQGKPTTLSLGIHGDDEITNVTGSNEILKSWSVRREGENRFLDLQINENPEQVEVKITTRSSELKLPVETNLTHLLPGAAIGFNSIVNVEYASGVQGKITEASGFAPLHASDQSKRFQTTTGGSLKVSLNRSGATADPVELIDTSLTGALHENQRSMSFQLRGTANVKEAGAEIVVLSGRAAVSNLPEKENYQLQLSTEDKPPVYKLVFAKPGTFPITLDFVAVSTDTESAGKGMDFTIAGGAVVPLVLEGLGPEIEFSRSQEYIVPQHREDSWLGFLPATGRARLQWKPARQAAEGKLFFTTTAQIETTVSAGLLRQNHVINYRVLQGELKSVQLQLHGPGEILGVEGTNIVAWKVSGEGEERMLDVTFSQAITGESQLNVRSQTALAAFPIRVEGLRLDPVGAIRHSGFLRIANSGSVRLEPTGLKGLTQLSPDQYPGGALEARQVFVYRFPAAEHAFTIAADRIEPEVNLSQLIVYELAETDRIIHADMELDIREAPIREWDFTIPTDYSVVSVTGASVADYITASEVVDGGRNLRVMFGADVSGRQLVSLHLEKSETAAAGPWTLPTIGLPGAKTVRGDIGIMAAAGFRVSVAESELLVEKPLSYFPTQKQSAKLQQAFRIRQPGWSATMNVEMLDRSVQSDVFHLYSLSEETIYGSALINYFVTGSPVSEWRITVPESLGNVMVDGQDVRTWRREGDTLIVSLHQGVMGACTLLVTFEEKTDNSQGSFRAGLVSPVGVQSERGYIQIVSPVQVETTTVSMSDEMLKLDQLELPAELRLLSTAPSLGTWQYTERPFVLNLKVNWFRPGTMVGQVVEFAEANSRVSRDGELVTDVTYFVKSRGGRSLRLKLPGDPVRLWEVSVDGNPVTARQDGDTTLIPLPAGSDPNIPVQISVRLGKPAVSESRPYLALPTVDAPVLKTQWSITGDEKHVLSPGSGTVTPPQPVLPRNGFHWVVTRGLVPLLVIGLLSIFGYWARNQSTFLQLTALACFLIAIGVSLSTAAVAISQRRPPLPLTLSLPILSAGEPIALQVYNTPLWRVNLSWYGLTTIVIGLTVMVWSFFKEELRTLTLSAGIFLLALGILWQGDGASWFYGLLTMAIFIFLFMDQAVKWGKRVSVLWSEHRQRKPSVPDNDADSASTGVVTSTIVALAFMIASAGSSFADVPEGFLAADSISQEWEVTHEDSRLSVSGLMKVSGFPGDRFVLLRAPSVLTRFDGAGLRLTKSEIPGAGLCYIVSIPLANNEDVNAQEAVDEVKKQTEYTAEFEYQLESIEPTRGMPVMTGDAAVAEIRFHYDETGWDVISNNAVRIETADADDSTQAIVLLGPGDATLSLTPRVRDVTKEDTQFFVEASQLYLPGPGVVDGRHRLHVRTSQGQVRSLRVIVPNGLTVSAVNGPVGSWQFDADTGDLKLEIEPPQSASFDVDIDTQRGLDPLPAEVTLAPLRVADADGEVGLVGIAFGPDAQPEKMTASGMSVVNLGDFDMGMMTNVAAVLHRVVRYGADEGEIVIRVAPVAPEVRVLSKQVLSLGDERVVLGVNFVVEITRAGLFQLSFALPEGLEVESLSGAALHHWSELNEDGQRQVVMHLAGKTIGTQSFALSLAGIAPADARDWEIPRFEISEATRQSGDLVVRPTTGIRLRTVTRQNVSEIDPRSMGGEAQGALAFRLLQRDWNLVLGVEKLDPWVTGQVLHEVTLREGQTRTTLMAHFDVQNASIRSLKVVLPITDADEIKTLRASGGTVSDLVRTAPESDVWEVQFKRRVVGKIDFRIEYERRGERANDTESLTPVAFPQTRQLAYYYAIRAGGRLELEHETLPDGWQRIDWSTVPAPLREAENRAAPMFAFRSIAATGTLTVSAKRHSLADALKLRVAAGTLTTILSPQGDQLTAVELTIEVIQRSSLSVGLPRGGELFSIFVNGESVNSIRQEGEKNAWQFTILPGIDDRTANVRFVYSAGGNRISSLQLTSPELNVPLENITWNVIAPKGYELTDHDGNLELTSQSNQQQYDRSSYLSIVSGKRQAQAAQAAQLLEQANELLQAGEQSKATWAFNSVANQYGLDAASNEDARVQLENLQTQQAIVGLNSRRQRLYLDNTPADAAQNENQQLRDAAANNMILQQDQMNFRPEQLSELLRGNTTGDNAVLQRIAGRLVHHQRTTEPAPQAILISLPEEGVVYTFARSVQVAEDSPLELDLDFAWQYRTPFWRSFGLIVLLASIAIGFAWVSMRRGRE
jgi:hypothetical protein